MVDALRGQLSPGHLGRRHVADVVHEDVEPSEVRERLLGDARDVVPDGDVALDGHRVTAELPHPRRRLLGAGGRAAVVDGDARPFAREPLGDRDAEPASGPCDEGDLPLEPTAHASSS